MNKVLKMSSNKGITLIALVITIIVLLILAGVSISMLTGDNGILKQASTAKTETERVSVEEEVQLQLEGMKIGFKKDGETFKENLKTKVKTGLQTQLDTEDLGTIKEQETYLRFDYKGEDIVVYDTGKAVAIKKVEPENLDDWEYDEESKTITFKEGATYISENEYDTLVVPNYYNGKKVEKVANPKNNGGYSYYIGDFKKIKANKIIISDGIEEIEDHIFGGYYLTPREVYLSKTLISIRENAFSINNIEEIKIPRSVQIIEDGAFGYSNNLTYIYCEISEEEKPEGWNEHAFYGNQWHAALPESAYKWNSSI